MLDYAVKLTREPWNVTADDLGPMRRAGLDDGAILDVSQVTAYYAFVNRLVDGLGVELEGFWGDSGEEGRALDESKRAAGSSFAEPALAGDYRQLYNETPIMMHSIDPRGVLVNVNDYWLKKLGYERDEVLGRHVTEFLTAESGEYARRVGLPRFLRKGYIEDVEYQMVTRDGRVLDVLLTATADRDEDGELGTSRAMVFDVSERKRAAAEREALLRELALKNAELEQFTYTVSHDLKSPLLTIKGFLGHLEKSAAAGNLERLRSDLARIEGAATQMQRLLDELLELSRIGRFTHPPEEVRLSDLAREVADVLSASLEKRGVAVEIADDLPVLRCDRLRMFQVFQNLFENAVKFMGDQAEPRITVGCAVRDEGRVCWVRDNGIGVEPEYHKRIFGLFEQRDSDVEGTGIGLALVRRILEVHGYRIWVESEGGGRGSAFCFTVGS